MGMQRVLVVDDSQNIQRLIKAVLVGHQLDVMVKENANQLVEWVKTHEIDLLLLDFSIDDSVDCYELVSKVKISVPHCKVVFLYGTFDEPDREKIGQFGVDDYIFKPFDGEKLVKTCLQLLGRDPRQQRQVRTEDFEKQELLQRLEEEVSHWNFPVPEIINSLEEESTEEERHEYGTAMPGAMGGTNPKMLLPTQSTSSSSPVTAASVSPEVKISKPVKYPQSTELEFPPQSDVNLNPDTDGNAYHVDNTAIVNLQRLEQVQEDKIGRLKAQIKEELEGKLWDSAEEGQKLKATRTSNRSTPRVVSQQNYGQENSRASNSSVAAPEDLFSQVEREAMKREILAEIRDKMVVDLKLELREQLRKELTQEWSNTLLMSIKDQVRQELLELSTQFLSEQLANSVKQHHLQKLLLDLQKRLDLLVESSWADEWHETVKKDLVNKMLPKAEELVKQELSAIRSQLV